MPTAIAGSLRRGLAGGEGFGLTNLDKSHLVHSCPVSALHTRPAVSVELPFSAVLWLAGGDL